MLTGCAAYGSGASQPAAAADLIELSFPEFLSGPGARVGRDDAVRAGRNLPPLWSLLSSPAP